MGVTAPGDARVPSSREQRGSAGVKVPRWLRGTFIVAGVYNVLWGLYAAVDPQWFFRFSELEPLNHPEIFACLGMVIGLYGILYLEVARRPERGFLIAAIGLAGKVLGPLGLAVLIGTGQWPPRSIVLCLTNDLVWWIPFSIYLVKAWPAFARDILAGRDESSLEGRG